MRVNPALQAAHALVKTVCIVRLRITAQKLVLISCRVARTYVSVSDRWVSYEPHDWPNFYVCVTVGRSDMSKFTEGSWQGSFTVNHVTAVQTLKPSSTQKIALREFLQGRNLLVYLPTGFPASSNRCRCSAAYSAI